MSHPTYYYFQYNKTNDLKTDHLVRFRVLPPERFPHVLLLPRALPAAGCGPRCSPAGTLLQVRVAVQESVGFPAVMIRSQRVIPLSHYWKRKEMAITPTEWAGRRRGPVSVEQAVISPGDGGWEPVRTELSPHCASSCSGSALICREQLIRTELPQPITGRDPRHVAQPCCVHGLRETSEQRQPKQNRFVKKSAWCLQMRLVDVIY